ncbi:acyl-CoA dehydrogenase family protein [Actinoallomurus sp. CA-142502]|uniref:acyl-CoA dehydrogenase family protein n=1 Tax=Actinoallomurus sp. CA-142502 TaxID=3239885 RepID=UPI003D8DCE38
MSVIDEIRRLADQWRGGEEEAAENRRLSDTTWKHLHELGILRGLQPARWGGGELDLAEHLTNVYEVARLAPSAGWVAGVVSSHPWQIALMADQAQQDFWSADAAKTTSSSYAPTGKAEVVDGGYRLSGRWSFSSGCDLCDGVILGANAGFVQAGDAKVPNFGSFLLTRDQYRIEDNWFTAGMRGTGSKDIVVDDAFVPGHRVLLSLKYEYNPDTPAPGQALNDGWLYRLPWAVMFNLVLVAPMLGAARGFLDAWTGETARRRLNWGGMVRDDPLTQLHLAEAEYAHEAAVMKMYDAVATITEAAKAGVFLAKPERARLRWNITRGCQEAGAAINHLYRISSGRTAYVDHPLHRLFQDVTTELGHAFLSSEAIGQYYGAGKLGASAPEVML